MNGVRIFSLDPGAGPPPADLDLPPMKGPGTELKRLIRSFGIRPSNCGCLKHAKEMDEKGVAWCRANVDVVAGWLKEEAKKRGWFHQLAAKMTAKKLVLTAIENAVRNSEP